MASLKEPIYYDATIESKELGAFLLDIGTSLLKAGANCNRTKVTITNVAKAYQLVPDISIAPNSILLSLADKNGNIVFDGIRSTSPLHIDFRSIAGISRLSSIAVAKNLHVPELKNELEKIRVTEHYSRIVILFFVSLAGAAFCYTFGGSSTEMAIAFGATFFGLFTKQQLTRYKINPYFCTYVAATAASLFVAIFHATGLAVSPVTSFSTCVLFLVPGVLLINCFTDILDGHIMNGLTNGVSALMHVLAIALGLATTIIIFNLNA
jgi:uncharacterized membrane protein YjjP (DUF1212 family)